MPYFTLQRIQPFPLRSVPEIALDRLVGFDPRWIWVYLSVCAAEGARAAHRPARGYYSASSSPIAPKIATR